jgi:antitoxin CcdA
MKLNYDPHARKKSVYLTLNQDLVRQAKGMTDDLSGVVESLLAEFVSRERRARLARYKAAEESIALWNRFNEDKGSLADEYSAL